MADIRIIDLPTEENPSPGDYVAVDGSSTRKATLDVVFNKQRPYATQAQAIEGVSFNTVMTPQRTAEHFGNAFAARVLDEDDLISDSADHVPTQQSVKTYIDTHPMETLAPGAVVSAAVAQRFMHTSAPFGRSGFRILKGEKFDAHYGWGGIVAFPSGKWVNIFRVGVDHGIKDNSVVYAEDSYDQGNSWSNRRVIYQNALSDARPDPVKLMANGRAGFFINRQDEGSTHFSPMFVHSDNEFVTFTVTEIPTTSPYTFQATGGIMECPAAVGGHDTLGYMAFGFLSAGGMDAFKTVNNGTTWTQVYEVANIGGAVTALSENWGFRVGSQNKWIFFSRTQDASGWRQMLTVFITTDPFNWGPPLDANVNLGGNPPGGLYDQATNKLHLLNVGRGGRGISVGGTFFEHHIMHIEVDADALFNANGDFAVLGLSYSVLAPIPNWGTGYFAPFFADGHWWSSFTCAEPGSAGGARSVLALVGNFIPTGAERSKWEDLFVRRQMNVRSIEMQADDNLTTTYPFKLKNLSDTQEVGLGAYGLSNRLVLPSTTDFTMDIAGDLILDSDTGYVRTPPAKKMILGGTDEVAAQAAMLTAHIPTSTVAAIATGSIGSNAARTHWGGFTLSGLAGSIVCTSLTTAYNTTSDELWKKFLGAYAAADALRIIRADPVRKFVWDDEHGGQEAVGWGAQTSYAVSKDLASPGGWFDPLIPDKKWKKGGVRWVDPEYPERPAEKGDTFWRAVDRDSPELTELPAREVRAVYVPWGVDQSKRTPYLWTAVAYLADERDAMAEEISSLKTLVEALTARLDKLEQA